MRVLSETEKEVIDILFVQKTLHKPLQGYVTSTEPLVLHKWNGEHPVEQNMTTEEVPKGTTLKIVMISRLGDFGLTNDLSRDYGYQIRLDFDSEQITNIRVEP